MSLLTRFSPLRGLSRIEPSTDFDDLFRGFGMRSLLRDLDNGPEIRLDVKEDENAYRIQADIPGVKKEDICVSVDGGRVSISAEVRRESGSENEKEVHSERYYGMARRAFSLPDDVDGEKAQANYEDGVLTLLLPRKLEGKSRRVAVS